MRKLCLAVFLCLCIVTSGYAIDYRVGVGGGMTAGGEINENEPAYGAHVQAEFNETFALELGVMQTSDEASGMEITDDGLMTMDWDGEVDITAVTLIALARVPATEKLSFYAGIGAGYYFLDMDWDSDFDTSAFAAMYPGLDVSTEFDAELEDAFAMSVMAGTEYAFNGSWSVFLDYRYAFLKPDEEITVTTTVSYRGEVVTDEFKDTEEVDFEFGIVRAGINYSF